MEKNAISGRKNLVLTFAACIVFVALNFLTSLKIELSYDEAYYWIYSNYLSFGYYDHPPVVAWTIAFFTKFLGNNEFAVRLGSQLYLFGTAFLLFKELYKTTRLSNILILILSMPLISLSGIFALPDSALMFFSTYFIIKIKDYLKVDNFKNSALLALSIAMMFYSKYHGLLIVLLTVIAHPSFFKKKSFWAIVVSVILLYMPHMYWQYLNDFVSFRFHLFGRVEKHFELKNILDYIGGQFALMGILLVPLFIFYIKKLNLKDPYTRILFFNSFGFLAFLFLMSFRNQIEANWTISCSVALILLFSSFVDNNKKYFLIAGIVNISLFIALRGVLLFSDQFVTPGEENRINEIHGWKPRIQKILNLCEDRTIVGDNYQVSSKLAFYIDRPEIPSLHFGSRESHYSILNLEKNLKEDESICYLTSKNILGARRIETDYKDPVFVISNIKFSQLLDFYKASYEEVVGK